MDGVSGGVTGWEIMDKDVADYQEQLRSCG